MRWLLRRFNTGPDAYCSCLKHRKSEYDTRKESVKKRICGIDHSHTGMDGPRTMTVYPVREGYCYCPAAISRYGNAELNLKSTARPGKPEDPYGRPHEIFENRLDQDFNARKANRKMVYGFHISVSGKS